MLDIWNTLIDRIEKTPTLLIGLDFDGTLTPIVARPEDARLSPGMREALRTLAGLPNVHVAVISGRDISDVRGLVGLPNLTYAGNHGLEVRSPAFTFVEPTAFAFRDELRSLCVDLNHAVRPIAGAWVECKSLTASVHYRAVALADVQHLMIAIEPFLRNAGHRFQISAGHAVHEIRPRLDWGKGAAARWIKARLGLAGSLTLYVGDDVTDEDAFREWADGITVRVGPPRPTAASHNVAGPDEIHMLLEKIAALWQTKQTSARN